MHAKVQAMEKKRLQSESKLNGTCNVENQTNLKLDRAASDSVFQRVKSSKILAYSGQEETEMTRHVSFLRSTSMMCSLPDLGEYAKSCRISNCETPNEESQKIRMPRQHTVSESFDDQLNESGTSCPSDESLRNVNNPKSQDRNLVRRVNSYHARMNLGRQVYLRRATNPNLSSLVEKDADSSLSLAPSEPIIEEEEEDRFDDEKSSPQRGDNEVTQTTVLFKPENPINLQISQQPVTQLPDKSKKDGRFSTVTKAMASCFDPEVLKTRKMIITSISVCLVAIGAPHFLFYLHAYAKSVSMDSTSVTTLLSISALVDLAVRLGTGALADMNIVHTSYMYTIR